MNRAVCSVVFVSILAILLCLPQTIHAQPRVRGQKELPVIARGGKADDFSIMNTNQNSSPRITSYNYGWQYGQVHSFNGSIFAFTQGEYQFQVVGGEFDSVDGVKTRNIAQHYGSYFTNMGEGVNGPVYAIAKVLQGQNIVGYIVGGKFDSAGNISAHNIAFWNDSQWIAIGDGTDSTVLAFAAIGNYLYVGGNFIHAGGMVANYIAIINLQDMQWSPLLDGQVNGVNGGVASLYTALNQPYSQNQDSTLYAGGGFTKAGAIQANKIALWDGEHWHAFGTGLSGVNSFVEGITKDIGLLHIHVDSAIYVGGSFDSAGSVVAHNVASWDTAWHCLGTDTTHGTNGPVYAINSDGGRVFITGDFSIAGDSIVNNIAYFNDSSWARMESGLNGIGYVFNGVSFGIPDVSPGSHYTYPNIGVYVGGAFTETNDSLSPHLGFWVDIEKTGITNIPEMQFPFLISNYPNPFAERTIIEYSVQNYGVIKIEILNALGEPVATLQNATLSAGHYTALFNSAGLPAGVYFLRMASGGAVQTRMMEVVR